MDESEKTDFRLEVSVSFGRFENDKLSLEKWSSFSPNKNLEEVGTLSTPGSVAQKKAYFEAHYKKIAARKAEELEQDGQMAPVALKKDVPSIKQNLEHSPGIEDKHGFCNGEKSYDETAMDANWTALIYRTVADGAQDKDLRSMAVVEQEGSTNGLMNVSPLDDKKGEALTAMESRNSMAQQAMEEVNVGMVDKELNVKEEVSLIEVKASPTASVEVAEHAPERKHVVELSSALKKKNSKLNSRNVPQKVTPPKMERNFLQFKEKGCITCCQALANSHAYQFKIRSIFLTHIYIPDREEKD